MCLIIWELTPEAKSKFMTRCREQVDRVITDIFIIRQAAEGQNLNESRNDEEIKVHSLKIRALHKILHQLLQGNLVFNERRCKPT